MRLLFVQDSLGAGGAEKSNLLFWEYLLLRSTSFKVVLLKNVAVGFEKEAKDLGVDYTVISGSNAFKKGTELLKIIQTYKPDIVHSVLYKASIYTRFAKKFSSAILVESLVNHSYDEVRLKDKKVSKSAFYLYKYLDKYTAPLVDHYIPITKSVQNHYISNLGIARNKMNVIYRGRHDNSYSRDRQRTRLSEEVGLDKEKVWLLQVGRQEFQKGHLHTLSALKLVQDITKKKIEVVFLGREGNASEDIKQFLNKNDLGVKVHFLGHRSDVPQFMRAADVFLFPSVYEGLGGALIEAQAACLPVICSDIPVLNEVVEDKKNALMFEVGNEGKLAEKIETLVNNDQLRKEMGANSLLRFEKHFRIEKIHQEMMDFYDSLISPKV